MDAATLKKLRISNQRTFDKLVKLGWIEPTGKELGWRDWRNRATRENIGRSSERFVAQPYTKSDEERGGPRILRHDYPTPVVQKTK